jgi:hypothetical protein
MMGRDALAWRHSLVVSAWHLQSQHRHPHGIEVPWKTFYYHQVRRWRKVSPLVLTG